MELFTFFSLALLLLLMSDELSTSGKPYFRDNGEPTDELALEGESCQFKCSFSGLRTNVYYLVRWEFGITGNSFLQIDDSISHNEKYHISTNLDDYASRLVVNNITIDDQGFYRCWLYENNMIKLGSTSGYLKVLSMPWFSDKPTDQTVVEGESVILPCSLENFATEALYVVWFLNGENISRNYSINQPSVPEYLEGLSIDNSEGPGVFDLRINRVGKKGGGTFKCQCKAYLEGRRRSILKSTSVEITVIYPPASEFPKCKPSSLNAYYKEGDVLDTTCGAHGGNAPVYFQWYRDGEMRNGTVVNKQQLVMDEWTLTEGDDGKYIYCYMKGPAILKDRQCAIGPIKVQASTKISLTPKYDSRTTVAATSEFRSTLKFKSHILQSKPMLSTSLISTMSPTTQNSVSVEKAGTTYSAYIITVVLLVFISTLVAIAVFIIRKRCIECKKKCVKEPFNVNERDNANSDLTHYEEMRLPRHAREDLSLQPELNLTKIELRLNESSLGPLTNDNVAIDTVDVTYAQVCKVKRPKTKQDIGEEKKSRNVEGLIYADLDLHQNENRDLTAAVSPLRDDSSVTYAEVQVSRPPSTKK